jgi:hypothetical protein
LYEGFTAEIYSPFISKCNYGIYFDGRDNGHGCHNVNIYGGEITEGTSGLYLKERNNIGVQDCVLESLVRAIDFADDSNVSSIKVFHNYFEDNNYDIYGLKLYDCYILYNFFGETGKVATDHYIACNRLLRTCIKHNFFGSKTNYCEIDTISIVSSDIYISSTVIEGNTTSDWNFTVSQLILGKLVDDDIYGTNFVQNVTGSIIKNSSSLYYTNSISFRSFPHILMSNGQIGSFKYLDIDDALNVAIKKNINGTIDGFTLSRFIPTPPSNSNSNGNRGDWSANGTDLFFCISTNGWIKVTGVYF